LGEMIIYVSYVIKQVSNASRQNPKSRFSFEKVKLAHKIELHYKEALFHNLKRKVATKQQKTENRCK